MGIGKLAPAVVYDDRCYLCSKFAHLVYHTSRGRLALIGHYTRLGEEIKPVLGTDARSMFWFIDGKTAYGGRAALVPLIMAILSGKTSSGAGPVQTNNATGCKSASAVFVRSASLITSSKKVAL